MLLPIPKVRASKKPPKGFDWGFDPFSGTPEEGVARAGVSREVPRVSIKGGRTAGLERLEHFVQTALPRYDEGRNEPAAQATSGLSPYLHFGHLGAAEIASSVRAGDVSPSDMVRASFNRAREIGVGPEALNIYLHSDEKASLEEADAMHERIGRSADVGVLAGVPVAIKDNIASLGLPTTCASKILAGYVSPFEATAITRP